MFSKYMELQLGSWLYIIWKGIKYSWVDQPKIVSLIILVPSTTAAALLKDNKCILNVLLS